MFAKSLYWHARLVAPLLCRLRPAWFADDLKFIRLLGTSTDSREIRVDLANFRDMVMGNPSFLRTSLKIRVSGRKAGRLAQRLFFRSREREVQDRVPAREGAIK